jgi:hypothetical protein
MVKSNTKDETSMYMHSYMCVGIYIYIINDLMAAWFRDLASDCGAMGHEIDSRLVIGCRSFLRIYVQW